MFFKRVNNGLKSNFTKIKEFTKQLPSYLRKGLQTAATTVKVINDGAEKVSTLKNIASSNGLNNQKVEKIYNSGKQIVEQANKYNDRAQKIGGEILSSNIF